MKRLALGAAAVGGAAFAVLGLARRGREMHGRCSQMMRDNCRRSTGACRPE
jgi:hypothetical protein